MNPIGRIIPLTDAEAAQMVSPGTLADFAKQVTDMPIDPAAAETAPGSVASHTPRQRSGRPISIPAVAALAVAALLITWLGAVASGHGGRGAGSGPAVARSAQHTGVPRNPTGWDGNLYPLGPPGLGAQNTTIAGAQVKAGFPVALPSTSAASMANLSQVWVNTHGEVALVFDNGKVDITMHRASYQSALSYFQAFVAEKNLNKMSAEIGSVNGQPALVVTPNTDAYTQSNPAVVSFWRNGVFISVFSNAYGTNTLLALANSMR